MCAFAAIRLHVITFVTSARHVVKRLVRVAILLTGFFALFIGPVGATPGIPGTLDPFFATGSALGPGKLLQSITAGGDLVSAVVLRPDGKLLLAGACSGHYCAMRLNPDGTLDTSFNATGWWYCQPRQATTITISQRALSCSLTANWWWLVTARSPAERTCVSRDSTPTAVWTRPSIRPERRAK